MLNNPINAADPSGHKCVGEPDECLNSSGKPINGSSSVANTGSQIVTRTRNGSSGSDKALEKLKRKDESSREQTASTNDSNFFSELAYAADNVGAGAANIEMMVVDTIDALVIADGCMTAVGCLPALGFAVGIDMGISMYSPFGILENMAGGVAAGSTIISDFITGTSYVHLAADGGIDVGVGRDSVVSVTLGVLGQIPEANFDAVVSSAQLEYDNRRRAGDLAAVSYQFHIPGAPNLWGNGNGWPNGAPWE